jgi:hypothetical protein
MSNKKRFLVLILILNLISCQAALPDNLPNTGNRIDPSAINKFVKVNIPKKGNTFILGEPIYIELINISDQRWLIDINEIKMYFAEKESWVLITDDMLHIGTTSIKLEAKDTFPGDRKIVVVSPHLNNNTQIDLIRLVVTGKNVDSKGFPIMFASYADVYLK